MKKDTKRENVNALVSSQHDIEFNPYPEIYIQFMEKCSFEIGDVLAFRVLRGYAPKVEIYIIRKEEDGEKGDDVLGSNP